jgi:hypothetical protein
MAQLAVGLTLGQSIGTPSGPDYPTTQVGNPPDPTAAAAAVVTDLTTAFTAFDVFGNALVAITGDTYSDTTHKWTTGGATGLTHAQVATLMADYNTAITSVVTGLADANTAHGGVSGADMIITFDGTKFTSKNQVLVAGRRLLSWAAGLVSF